MIVKTDRDGRFFVAGNSNWRLAGPFTTHAEAWAWIDRKGFEDGCEGLPAPSRHRHHERQPRTETDVTKHDVLALAPVLLRLTLRDSERGFVLSMEKRALRKGRELRLTEKQSRWWKILAKRVASEAAA